MSNTIVMNTMTGAVSEYSNFAFTSASENHFGSAAGIFVPGGNSDFADPLPTPVVAVVDTGKRQWGSTFKKFLGVVFFAIRGTGTGTLTVTGETSTNTYNLPIEASGESRCKPGRGIRENYLAFGFSNSSGGDFQLDRVEVELFTSETRRTR